MVPARRFRVPASAVAAILATGGLAAPRLARADVIEACTSAVVSGQQLQRSGKLQDARARFLACVRPECPGEVKAVCDGLLSTVDSSLPTVIFGARSGEGQDLVDVRVLVDGAAMLASLDGKATTLDPGPHALRFEHEGSAAIEQRVVIREAEKGRLISVTFARASAPPPPSAAPAEQPTGARPTPVLVYVLGGVGVVSLGGFAYLAAHGQSEYDGCKATPCPESTVNALGVDRALAFGALGVGVVSLGVGTWLWLARPTRASQGVSLRLAPSPGGGSLVVGF